jgi:beta-xylosidase
LLSACVSLLTCFIMFLSSVTIEGLLALRVFARNSTFQNPMLPGFHPDPSCILFLIGTTHISVLRPASSSFLAFVSLSLQSLDAALKHIAIHASRDLIDYKLVSNALRRPEQEPGLNTAKRATSGIWASTIRYREGIFYVATSLVYDDYPKNTSNRFDSFVITSTVCSASWSNPFHFSFTGYDTSPFWDESTMMGNCTSSEHTFGKRSREFRWSLWT